jgi:multidrug efflux pump subunit AcrA (membrane-fusion protein)
MTWPVTIAVTALCCVELTGAAFAQTSSDEFATRVQSAMNTVNCTIRPSQSLELSTAVAGIVARRMVAPGQHVEAGDVLLQLDTGIEQAELALREARAAAEGALLAAQARRDGLRDRVTRLEAAFERGAVTAVDLESARTELNIAEGDMVRTVEQRDQGALEAAITRHRIEKATLRSPVAGIVDENIIGLGEATGSRPLVTVHVVEPLRVEAFVPVARLSDVLEKEIHAVRVGTGDHGTRHAVALDYAAPLVDQASNTVSVYFILSDENVLPGSQCALISGV